MPGLTEGEIELLRSHPHTADIYLAVYRPAVEEDWHTLRPRPYRLLYLPIEESDPPEVSFAMRDEDGEDIEYDRQHLDFAPVPVMGPPVVRILERDELGELVPVIVHFDGSDSYTLLGNDIDEYLWDFPGGSPDSSSSAVADVEYDTPGFYYAKLTVTALNADGSGTVEAVGYRQVYVLYPEAGLEGPRPYTQWVLESLEGNRGSGGWKARVRAHDSASPSVFPDGAHCVIFSKMRYGGTPGAVGGNLLFAGWIQEGETGVDSETGEVLFELVGTVGLMDRCLMDSFMIESVGECDSEDLETWPTDWTQMCSPTPARILWHICAWHSNLLTLVDVFLPDVSLGNTAFVKSQDIPQGSLLNACNDLLRDYDSGAVVSDRTGRVFMEPDIQCIPEARREADTVMTLTKGDWIALQIPEDRPEKTVVRVEGIAYSPTEHGQGVAGELGGASPLGAIALTGDLKLYSLGDVEERSGQILRNQEHARQLAHLLRLAEANQYRRVTIPLLGAYTVFDIAPQEFVRLPLVAEDTRRGLVWAVEGEIDHTRLVPREVRVTYRGGGVLDVTLQAEKEVLDAGELGDPLDFGLHLAGSYLYIGRSSGQIQRVGLPGLRIEGSFDSGFPDYFWSGFKNPSGSYVYLVQNAVYGSCCARVIRFRPALWDDYVSGEEVADSVDGPEPRSGAFGVAISPLGDYAYCCGVGKARLDLSTFTFDLDEDFSDGFLQEGQTYYQVVTAVVSPQGRFLYCGTNQWPAKLAKVQTSDLADLVVLSLPNTLQLPWGGWTGHGAARGLSVTPDGRHLYLGAHGGWPGNHDAVVRVQTDDFKVDEVLELWSRNTISRGCLGLEGDYYYISAVTSGHIDVHRIALSTFTLAGTVGIDVPGLVWYEGITHSVDPVGEFLYIGAGYYLLAIRTSDFTYQGRCYLGVD